jgi:F-type H+-transporting ATPase subunit a
MIESPLVAPVLIQLGPVAVTEPVAVTWAIMIVLGGLGALSTRHLTLRAGRWQTIVEAVVTMVEEQLAQTMQTSARPFLPLLGTLFLFLVTANLSGLLPGITSPTAYFEPDAALALIVLVAVQAYGICRRGARDYLASFARPSLLMLPLNILSEVTRTFSLMVRLFGNVMSGHVVIAIVLSLAGLLVPIPSMALEIIVGVVQAYIFTVLSAVYIGAAVGAIERG